MQAPAQIELIFQAGNVSGGGSVGNDVPAIAWVSKVCISQARAMTTGWRSYAIAEALHGTGPNPVPIDDALTVMVIVAATTKSAQSKATITFRERPAGP